MSGKSSEAGRRPVAFISHHSSQEQTARHLKTILERNGVEGWMAPDDIEPGRPFDEAIMQEMEACDLIVLLFCARSDQSRHVKRELMMAENHDKLIYPVRLEDIDAKGLAYWLNDYQWIDWLDRRDETIHKLVETIKKQIPIEEPETAENEADRAKRNQPGSPAAEPAAQDAAPIPLMTAETEDVDEAKNGFSLAKLTTSSWAVIGGIGIVGAVALALALGSGDELPIEPGSWETRSEITDISGAPAVRQYLESQFAARSTTWRECVTEDEAADPATMMVEDIDLEDYCQITRSSWSGGDIEFEAICRDVNAGTQMNMEVEGRYNRTQSVARQTIDLSSPIGNGRIVTEYRGRRLGDCD